MATDDADADLLRADLEIVIGDGPSDPNPAPVASEVTNEQPSAAIATRPPEPTSLANPALKSIAPAPSGKDEIELATGYVPRMEDGTRMCLMARGGGALAVNPRTGLGFTDPSSGAVTDVVWPEGYSAWFQDGNAILIDESGNVVAREGELITMAGGYSSDNNVFHICGAGIVE